MVLVPVVLMAKVVVNALVILVDTTVLGVPALTAAELLVGPEALVVVVILVAHASPSSLVDVAAQEDGVSWMS